MGRDNGLSLNGYLDDLICAVPWTKNVSRLGSDNRSVTHVLLLLLHTLVSIFGPSACQNDLFR